MGFKGKRSSRGGAWARAAVMVALACAPLAARAHANAIDIYPSNPSYWQYRGQPMLLLGGSKDDNLFQIPDLLEHLDELRAAGINYIRNTMSDRQDGGFEAYAFAKTPAGKYDLDHWNQEYWQRFHNLLQWTHERDIIVQIEVWDRFDYSQEQWAASPWRPANNVNYTAKKSGLANDYPQPAWRDQQPFFHTAPGVPGYRPQYDLVRAYQERFVAKLLSYSLDYPHVLYCMNNETSTHHAWGLYWMEFIARAAAAKGVKVHVTDMFDDGWQPWASDKLRVAIARPESYSFIDISQVNSRCFNEEHWNRFTWTVQQLEAAPRPLNHVKIYSDGQTSWGSGTPVDGVERFWRNLIGGAAACRFHRPGGGIGANAIAKACIAAARKLETLVKFWDVKPRLDLLSQREPDEAYLAAAPGHNYVLYFTDGGAVTLDLSGHDRAFRLKWISIATGDWGGEETLPGGAPVAVAAPGSGGWVAAIVRR